jgi:hypothetical protein
LKKAKNTVGSADFRVYQRAKPVPCQGKVLGRCGAIVRGLARTLKGRGQLEQGKAKSWHKMQAQRPH